MSTSAPVSRPADHRCPVSGVELLARPADGLPRSVFASPRGVLLAEGVQRTITAPAATGTPAHVRRALEGGRVEGLERPVVIGAIPFSPDSAAHLVIPARAERGMALVDGPLPDRPPSPSPGRATVTSVPAPSVYTDAVAEAVRRLRDPEGSLEKIVLARTLEVSSATPIDQLALLRTLALRDPGGYAFSVDLPPAADRDGPRSLVGASPELLLSRIGDTVVSNPLAGSRPRSADPAEDAARAAELLVSAKDRHEHAVVARAVGDTLAPFCSTLHVPEEPTVIATRSMWHLSTRVEGRLADPSTDALTLALALHPTPAVCGTPTDDARRLIGELEPFDRGMYSGMVGWTDLDGDGEWVVTIRCADVQGSVARLYAGAGVVADSDPQAELAETSAKSRTVLEAMGLTVPPEASS